MTTWVPGDNSPDRIDAMVWGFTFLFLKKKGGGFA
jgi:phage terminase large subunit-like protein